MSQMAEAQARPTPGCNVNNNIRADVVSLRSETA